MKLSFWQNFFAKETSGCVKKIHESHSKNQSSNGIEIYNYIQYHLSILIQYGLADFKLALLYSQENLPPQMLAMNYQYGQSFNLNTIKISSPATHKVNNFEFLANDILSCLNINDLEKNCYLGSKIKSKQKLFYLMYNIYQFFELTELSKLCKEQIDEDQLERWKKERTRQIELNKNYQKQDAKTKTEHENILTKKTIKHHCKRFPGFYGALSFWTYLKHRIKRNHKIIKKKIIKLEKELSNKLYMVKDPGKRDEIKQIYNKQIKKYNLLTKKKSIIKIM